MAPTSGFRMRIVGSAVFVGLVLGSLGISVAVASPAAPSAPVQAVASSVDAAESHPEPATGPGPVVAAPPSFASPTIDTPDPGVGVALGLAGVSIWALVLFAGWVGPPVVFARHERLVLAGSGGGVMVAAIGLGMMLATVVV